MERLYSVSGELAWRRVFRCLRSLPRRLTLSSLPPSLLPSAPLSPRQPVSVQDGRQEVARYSMGPSTCQRAQGGEGDEEAGRKGRRGGGEEERVRRGGEGENRKGGEEKRREGGGEKEEWRCM